MIEKNRRIQIYNAVFGLLADYSVGLMPTPLELICNGLGIGLVPLSVIATEMKLKPDEVKSRWLNENGQLMVYNAPSGARAKIAYNDSNSHRLRRRFTIAEELSHYILRHYDNRMYSVNGRLLDFDVYRKHEEEARFAVGLLLCPPPFYYRFPALLNCAGIRLCSNVSSECAVHCVSTLRTYFDEITSVRRYAEISAMYRRAEERNNNGGFPIGI